MSTLIELPRPQVTWSRPAATPLDEAVWQAWVAKGRAQERRSTLRRIKAVKWASVAALLAAAGLWSHLAPVEVVVRFLVTTGATVLMFHTLHARNYAVAAVFGALALFYNPLLPVVGFSGDWQRAVVGASTVPFIASLIWPNGRNRRTESNG